MKAFLQILLAAGVLAACNYHDDKSVDDEGGEAPAAEAAAQTKPGFAEVTAKVFKPRCNSCHSSALIQGNTNLDNYEDAKEKADDIREQVFELKLMPLASTLTTTESEVLRAWLDEGAPETAPAP